MVQPKESYRIFQFREHSVCCTTIYMPTELPVRNKDSPRTARARMSAACIRRWRAIAFTFTFSIQRYPSHIEQLELSGTSHDIYMSACLPAHHHISARSVEMLLHSRSGTMYSTTALTNVSTTYITVHMCGVPGRVMEF